MKSIVSIAVLSALLLTACSGNTVKTTLGIDRAPPDEFRVVSRPPLSVPPQFTLRPPVTNDETAGQTPASEEAKSLVTGTRLNTGSSKKTGTHAESQFLKNAGAENADPNVREKIVEDRIAVQQPEESNWWNPLSWGNNSKKDPLVNAKKEAERIQKNEDEGKPVTEGETPEVKAKDTGVLGRILGY